MGPVEITIKYLSFKPLKASPIYFFLSICAHVLLLMVYKMLQRMLE